MLVKFALGFMLAFSAMGAQAQNQPELPLGHPDEILVDAWLFSPNVRLADPSTLPTVVSQTLADIDVGFEMGDGYFGLQATATYEVSSPTDPSLVVGYMNISVLSYTEDSNYRVATIYVNPQGRLVNPDWVIEASPYDEDEIKADFPPELQIPETEE
ncbi:MAG: hypothetical protein AAB250_07550 [Bdellovibrionota bacterium]